MEMVDEVKKNELGCIDRVNEDEADEAFFFVFAFRILFTSPVSYAIS